MNDEWIIVMKVMMMNLFHNFHDNQDLNYDYRLFLVDNNAYNIRYLEEYEEFYMFEIQVMKYQLENLKIIKTNSSKKEQKLTSIRM
jgi:hypothetical protein